MQELRETEFKDLYSDRSTDDFIQYVKDCVIETDLEIRIPDDYVNNVAERLSLYQKLILNFLSNKPILIFKV